MAPTALSHNEINLHRLVRRLEKSSSDPHSSRENDPLRPFKIQAMLQNVKYARKLLRDLELTYSAEADVEPQKAQYFDTARSTLDRIQSTFESIHEGNVPRIIDPVEKPESILSRIPPPNVIPSYEEDEAPISPSATSSAPFDAELLLPSEGPSPSWADSFSTLSPMSPPSSETIPSRLEGTSTGATSTALPPRPAFLQNSQQIQQELSDQLAQMATQLKRNATHFARALEEDKVVMDQTEQKLEGNMGSMTKEKGRLKDYSGKSRGTTLMTFLILSVVVFVFIAMVALIRLTRW